MRWEIERYVKLYRRDTAEWMAVPWQARGLFDEMLRKTDRDGEIVYGRLEPAAAVGLLVGGEAAEIARWLPDLLADGCVTDDVTRRRLVIGNYRAAQGEPMTGSERTAKWRKHKKDVTPVTARDGCDERDAPSEPAEPSRAEPIQPSQPGSQRSGNGTEKPGRGRPADLKLEDLAELRSALALQLGKDELGVGRRPERVLTSFGRWLRHVGVEATVSECVRIAAENNESPDHLSWWCGWLDTVSDAKLERAGEASGAAP